MCKWNQDQINFLLDWWQSIETKIHKYFDIEIRMSNKKVIPIWAMSFSIVNFPIRRISHFKNSMLFEFEHKSFRWPKCPYLVSDLLKYGQVGKTNPLKLTFSYRDLGLGLQISQPKRLFYQPFDWTPKGRREGSSTE